MAPGPMDSVRQALASAAQLFSDQTSGLGGNQGRSRPAERSVHQVSLQKGTI